MALSVRNWDKNFENSESRKIVHANWVRLPVKHDGKGYRRLMALKNGWVHYAAWVLILQVAAKCEPRGVLRDSDGDLTTEDLAFKTGVPASVFDAAIPHLISIGWLESPDTPGQSPDTPGSPGTEQNRTEQNRTISTGAVAPQKFIKPSVQEVGAYISEKGYHFDPKRFVAHYQSKGWLVGKSPMKDWRAACVTWEQTWKEQNGVPESVSNPKLRRAEVEAILAKSEGVSKPVEAPRAKVPGASFPDWPGKHGVGR